MTDVKIFLQSIRCEGDLLLKNVKVDDKKASDCLNAQKTKREKEEAENLETLKKNNRKGNP